MSAIPLIITPEKLGKILTKKSQLYLETWSGVFISVCETYKINTLNRIASFLGQSLHESLSLGSLEENLNYKSATRLIDIFPHDFKDLEEAESFVGNPEKIGNRVYANQNGNGDEASGDGYKYRGRGIGHLTGKGNYGAYSKFKNMDFVAKPDLLKEPLYAADSFAWFWMTHNLNKKADIWDLNNMTLIINGGHNGLKERKELCNKAKAILNA